MKTANSLRTQAIAAAKSGDWKAAADHNRAIVELNPEDTSALNRLGVAYLQLKKKKKAQDTFKQVLKIDKTNSIAQKQLERLKKNMTATAPSFSRQSFIEEPGKTKTISLHRLAGKKTLEKLSVGQSCQLKPKSRYISIESDGVYLGALPEDLSFRLSKLIKTGNRYECAIYSCGSNACNIYLKEVERSKRNSHLQSFPTNKAAIQTLHDMDDRVLLEEDVPMEIVETDSDSEKTLEKMPD